MLCARRFLSLLACAASATGRFLLLQSCAFLPSPRRPTAAAATSILEGSLDDQAISILAQAKLRILAIPCALKFSVLEKKKTRTTKTRQQGLNTRTKYFSLPGAEQLLGGHYKGDRKLRSNPQSVPESSDSIPRLAQIGLGHLHVAPCHGISHQ